MLVCVLVVCSLSYCTFNCLCIYLKSDINNEATISIASEESEMLSH